MNSPDRVPDPDSETEIEVHAPEASPPLSRPWAPRGPGRVVSWIAAILGGFSLLVLTIGEHRSYRNSYAEADQKLHRRHVAQLLDVHHVLTLHPDQGLPSHWLSGYLSAGEAGRDIVMAYEGAIRGEFLPPAGFAEYALVRHYLGEADPTVPLDHEPPRQGPPAKRETLVRTLLEAPENLTTSQRKALNRWATKLGENDWWGRYLNELATAPAASPDHEATGNHAHPTFRRLHRHGIAYFVTWFLTLLFAPAALRTLFRRPEGRPTGIWQRWQPGQGLALAFWGLLLGQIAVTAFVLTVSEFAPHWWEIPASHLTSSVLYLLLQGVPVLVLFLVYLPRGRHFLRVLGLGPAHLAKGENLRLVLGLYALYAVLGLGLYFVEKQIGSYDTRDFLMAGLIDANAAGLLAELFAAAIIAPIGEEILFRGLLYNVLRSRLHPFLAAFLSSMVFAGLHFYSWLGMASILLFGLLMCWVYHRTRSLWPGILLHALSNFTITLGNWYVFSEPPTLWGWPLG